MNTDFVAPVTCRICNQTYDIHCNKTDYDKWKSGEGYVQDVLSYLSADQREMLISATCGKCFDELFPPEECEYDEN